MTNPQGNTGEPNWPAARTAAARLREMPPGMAEANVQTLTYNILQALFPKLPATELQLEMPTSAGPADIYCRNAIFEIKRQGKIKDVRTKPDGTLETPQEQAVRYLDAITSRPGIFQDTSIPWRAAVTDGKEFEFYDYDRTANPKLTLTETVTLNNQDDDDKLIDAVYRFIDRTARLAPPTSDTQWAEAQAEPFIQMASACQNTPAFKIKKTLWRDLLKGAFLTPPDDQAAEQNLFARHTMLVATARTISEILQRGAPQNTSESNPYPGITQGFTAWLNDAAGPAGRKVLDNLIEEIDRYNWAAAQRDTLKDLYHTVIPKQIRHDFGEYYTPDWLAQAVCEEVMDPDWVKDTIDQAIAKKIKGPAVLDPSCGSGTFLYHATRILLAEAESRPELADKPKTQFDLVNGLVAGLDLHPVAVELAKTTKLSAFSKLASFNNAAQANIHLGDSLQWEIRGKAEMTLGNQIAIKTDEPKAPLSFPQSFLLNPRFSQNLTAIFQFTNRPHTPSLENELCEVLNLTAEYERKALIEIYRRMCQYIAAQRNHVWHWYIENLVQPIRLTETPPTRLVGNPPWVVYNAMDDERQDIFRNNAKRRSTWAGGKLATQNDLAATFVATAVDYYLQPGGKFGFVLPYAALKARHWEPFRTGKWNPPEHEGRGRVLADLSPTAWDFFKTNAPPFPQANSCAVFGQRLDTTNPAKKVEPLPLESIKAFTNTEPIHTLMTWEEVKPRLKSANHRKWPTGSNPKYIKACRQGATLVPQSLVIFSDENAEYSSGEIRFQTETAKGDWNSLQRDGIIEERFAKPAIFAKHIVPFGITGQLNVIGPFADDNSGLLDRLPTGDNAHHFRIYWSQAKSDYSQTKKPKSPDTLDLRINHSKALSAKLAHNNKPVVVYNRAGSYLASTIVPKETIVDSTLYWIKKDSQDELNYLAAIFNAPYLIPFFQEACRASDRDFHTGPIKNLPIPDFNPKNKDHANLANQSELAHAIVAKLVADNTKGKKITRNQVLNHPEIKPILDSIDKSVKAILPEYCS